MSTGPRPDPTPADADAADRAALDAARAAQRNFADRYLRDLPSGLAPAFRFAPDD